MPVRAQQPGLGWAEAGRAVGTALFPLPRPLGPPPLSPALHRPRSGRRPLVRLPEAGPSGPFLLGRGEAVSLPLPRAPSQRPALLVGKRPVGISGLSRPGRVFSQGKAVFTGKLSFLLHLLHLPTSLRPEWYFSTTSASHVNISPTLLLCGISLSCENASATTREKRLDPSAQVMKIPLNCHGLLTWLIASWSFP